MMIATTAVLAASTARAAQAAPTQWDGPITQMETDVLVVVDVQNDFLPGGALGSPGSDSVIAPINELGRHFRHIVLTQDWHPQGHISFASSHAGKVPFDSVKVAYGDQVLWPDHCVQGSKGAEFSPALKLDTAELVIRKGYHKDVDSYSAFIEGDHQTRTGLAGYLKARGFKRVFVCGLATDFCVGWTAMDARSEGLESAVIEDASHGIDLNGSLAAAWAAMQRAGVGRIKMSAIA